jgi:hypothetical protein
MILLDYSKIYTYSIIYGLVTACLFADVHGALWALIEEKTPTFFSNRSPAL